MVCGQNFPSIRFQKSVFLLSSIELTSMSQPSLWGTAAAVGLASGLIGYVSIFVASSQVIADSLRLI